MSDHNFDEIAKKMKPIDLPPLPEKPLVSVLMANYNYGKYVGEAIESVLRQTYQNCEIVVCDDGSTDDSRDVVQRYCERDRRVRLIAKENGGIASALNAAYAASRGDIICLLDADDLFLPEKIEGVVGAFRRFTRAGVCHHRILKMDAEGRPFGCPIPVVFAEGWVAPRALRGGSLVDGMASRQEAAASAMSWRRPVVELIFPVPPQLRRLVDWYMSRTAQFITEICVVPGVLSKQRFHGENVTSSAEYTVASVTRSMEDMKQVVEQIQEFLLARYGGSVASELRLEDSSLYCSFRVVLHVLRAAGPDGEDEERPWEVVKRIRPFRQRLLAGALLALPRPVSFRLLRLWAGTSPWEAAVLRTGRRFLRV